MNILVRTYEGQCIARPDTTIDKENGDIYLPEEVQVLAYTPVLFARICKAGKAVKAEFVDRYYDSIAFGMLLYPSVQEDCIDLSEASCFDHSTLLPYPLYNRITLGAQDNLFVIKKDGRKIFSAGMEGMKEKVCQAIVSCSAHTSIRIGDFVAVELEEMKRLIVKEQESCAIKASFCDNESIDIRINY